MNNGLDSFFAALKATKSALTWEDVLKNENLIGGDIESQEDGYVYRGPISKIEADATRIHFVCPWMARMDMATAKWEKWDITTASVGNLIQPQDLGEGRVSFMMPFIGRYTIFPKGSSKLEAHKVEGLPKDWERLLALYPGLKFDRKIAEKVMVDQVFVRARAQFVEKSTISTVQDTLRCFTRDDSREEFLWHYVEAVIGEKDVCQKVY